MDIWTGFVAGFVIGGALFYAIAWNAALHPGKLSAQFSRWWAWVRSKFSKEETKP